MQTAIYHKPPSRGFGRILLQAVNKNEINYIKAKLIRVNKILALNLQTSFPTMVQIIYVPLNTKFSVPNSHGVCCLQLTGGRLTQPLELPPPTNSPSP